MKRSADADELIALLPETRFVNEVGLDFGKRQADTVREQADAFRRIAAACAEQGGKVLSIHAVKAARETLDILEQAGTLESCTCVFHWYSGPSDQLKRAIDAGCLFSVNKRMLATGKGREYVKAIPRGSYSPKPTHHPNRTSRTRSRRCEMNWSTWEKRFYASRVNTLRAASRDAARPMTSSLNGVARRDDSYMFALATLIMSLMRLSWLTSLAPGS